MCAKRRGVTPSRRALLHCSVLILVSGGCASLGPAAIRWEGGRVTVTRTETGETFDWIKATGGLLRVQSSQSPPAGAAVSVSHRGHWFFIEDSDLSSKATFSLLSHLPALQSGEVQRLVPLLTLPVGR